MTRDCISPRLLKQLQIFHSVWIRKESLIKNISWFLLGLNCNYEIKTFQLPLWVWWQTIPGFWSKLVAFDFYEDKKPNTNAHIQWFNDGYTVNVQISTLIPHDINKISITITINNRAIDYCTQFCATLKFEGFHNFAPQNKHKNK